MMLLAAHNILLLSPQHNTLILSFDRSTLQPSPKHITVLYSLGHQGTPPCYYHESTTP